MGISRLKSALRPEYIVKALILVLLLSSCRFGHPGDSAPLLPSNPASGLVDFYRGPLNHLNAVRYGTCSMHPTCSEYARQALAAYGPVKGWILTMDRLLRCGRDETTLAPIIHVQGEPKFYDPLILNK